MAELLYPKLSYKIIGNAFQIYNEIGFGMPEKFYQKAFATLLTENKIPYKKEQHVKLTYREKPVGKYFLDFVVDDKIVVELKVRPKPGYVHIKQVTAYLKSIDLPLAILIYFTRDGVKHRRILNPNNQI